MVISKILKIKIKIMAETKPTATASVKATSVQAKKSSNAISWIAPIFCIVAGIVSGVLFWEIPMGLKTQGQVVLARAQRS